MYVGKYKLMKTIGKGNFAKVKLAKHMPTGQEVSTEFRFQTLYSRILFSVPNLIIRLYYYSLA